MKRIACPNCGAPLPPLGSLSALDCAHCGGHFERAQLPTGAGKTLWALVLVSFVLASGVSLVLFVAQRDQAPPQPPRVAVPATPATPPPVAKATAPEPAPDPGLPVSKLPEMTGTKGWILLDAPGMSGTWADFQLQDNMGWMLDIGRHWAADLELTRLSIDGVRPNGGLDLSAREDWSVDASFASPALRQSAAAAAQVSEGKVASELRLALSASKVSALIDAASGRDMSAATPPAPTLGCELPALMEAARGAGLEPRPSYSLVLQWLPESGGRKGYWRWHISASTAGDAMKSVIMDPARCVPR